MMISYSIGLCASKKTGPRSKPSQLNFSFK